MDKETLLAMLAEQLGVKVDIKNTKRTKSISARELPKSLLSFLMMVNCVRFP